MSILTETKYLDECTFSSGSQADYDCTALTDWTDGDTGTGVSSQVSFDGRSCFKMDVVTASAGNVAIRSRDVGSFATPEWITIKTYFDTLGTLAANDYFSAVFNGSSYRLSIRFATDGLFVYDGTTWNEVGTNIVAVDTWQEWTFKWTVAVAGVVDVYLDNTLVASSVDCSDSTAGTNGTATFSQLGTTVQGLSYIDYIKIGAAQRYAGETWLIQEGGQLTIRTDTRWHANSPASMLGALSTQTVTEGKLIYDGTDVRWLAISAGSGDSPIGTTVTQGGVSGYYLGYWSSLTAAPATAIGGAGFIKFREVTGGPFSAGAITFGSGTGAATASGADVAGWIEIVADSASAITVPRLGEHEIRGDWFYLDDTNGSTAQQIQVPTNGGGAGTYCPGVWVETAEASGEYEYWPSLAVAADGWSRSHIGGAAGELDRRQNYVKDVGGGLIQFGEVSDVAGTHAAVAGQASTYAQVSHSSTYTVVSNVCTINYPTGHLLKTGATVGINFTSGGASALDNTFAITVIDAFNYSFALVTGDTSGNATVYPGLTITFTAHTLGIGDTVYCDFTSGGGADGNYTIYASGASGTAANTYIIAYPATAAVTSGNVTVHSRYVISSAAHGLAVGNRVYLNFTTGTGVNGLYAIVAVPDSGSFHVVLNNAGVAAPGNVTIQQIIGNVPPDNCHVRIPNVFLREAATASRASNRVDGTIATRPEWATTNAGVIDFEYAYSTWYMNFAQAYSVKLNDLCTYNAIIISECATALDLDNVGVSNISSLATAPLTLTSNFAGGTIQNCKFMRGGAAASSGHGVVASYCIGQTFTNVTAGTIQFARSTGVAIGLSYCSNLIFNNCCGVNGCISLSVSSNISINDYDHVDRIIGYTNATTPWSGISVGAGSINVLVDGMTFGYSGTVSNVHPYTGLVYAANGTDVTFRNMGTFASPLPCGTWRQSIYAMGVAFSSGGNNYNLRNQRLYIDDNMRTTPISTINSDKNITHESVFGGRLAMYPTATYLLLDAGLNSVMKGCKTGASSVTGQASVYGTHFFDMFISAIAGRYVLLGNEPTTETSSYFSMEVGTRKFNSAGGILMGAVGDQAIWEDQYYRKGHTGFQNTTPTMSGGTIGNYTIEYDIDVNDGNGFTGSWTVASGANLSAETIDPAYGFKLKVRITTTTANLTAITYLRFDTVTTASAQSSNLYPLDVVAVSANIKDISTGSNIQNARVLIWANDDSNYFYNASVSITGSGTTATVAHTAHGLSSGMKVMIRGVTNDDVYNGVFSVTVTGVDSYTYTTSSTIIEATADGTITSTYVAVSGLTDSNGLISELNAFTVDQPVTGWARKSTGSPCYIQGAITGTVDATEGLATTVLLVRDE